MDSVENQEGLLRRVPAGLATRAGAGWDFSIQVFNCREKKPSVDREKLRTHPKETQLSATDAILRLVAIDVRSIDDVEIKPPDAACYRVDVLPRPIGPDDPQGDPENPSHAQIESDPTIDSGSRFKKLKEALCRLAAEAGTWAISPEDIAGAPQRQE